MRSILKVMICGGLLVSAAAARSESPDTLDLGVVQRANPMPSAVQLEEALERMRPERERALGVESPRAGRTVPDVRSVPPPMPSRPAAAPKLPAAPYAPPTAAQSIDLRALVDAYAVSTGQARRNSALAGLPKDADLLLFLSFSIPRAKLRRLIEAAADAKATVVFRGPIDEGDTSMTKFAAQLRALKPARAGDLRIDPPAFQRFRVTHVPTYVVTKAQLGRQEGECAPPDAYASVEGDVLPDFALAVMADKAAPPIAAIARRFAAAHAARSEVR